MAYDVQLRLAYDDAPVRQRRPMSYYVYSEANVDKIIRMKQKYPKDALFQIACDRKVRRQTMNKKGIMVVTAALVIAAAAIWTKPASAFTGTTEQWSESGVQLAGPGHSYRGGMSESQFEAYRMERMKEMATYFGISTEGKSVEQLKQELKAAKENDAEKWEAFKAEHLAKRMDHLREAAQKRGIETEGKSAEQLLQELKKAHGEDRSKQPKDFRKEKTAPKPPATPQAPEAKPSPEAKSTPEGKSKPESQQAPGGKTKLESQQAPGGKTNPESQQAPGGKSKLESQQAPGGKSNVK